MDRTIRNFIFLLIAATAISAGVIVENIRTALKSQTVTAQIDVVKVKKEIGQSGLRPREAMHWKEVK